MSRTERDTSRIVRSWLEEGVDRIPDRVLDAVESRLPATHQRRANWLARRFPIMNTNTFRFGVAAALVVALALIGWRFLPGSNIGGDPTPTPAASSLPTSPSSAVSFTDLEGGGTELQPGDYLVDYAAPVRVTFTVPDEPYEEFASHWYKALFDWGPWHQTNRARIAFLNVQDVKVDPCTPDLGSVDPGVGPTVDDLAEALAAVPGLVTEPAEPVTVDGYSGLLIRAHGAERPADCVDEPMIWTSTRGEPSNALPGTQDNVRIYVLDVDGSRLVIWAAEEEGFSESSQVQQVLDSIQIDPA
jgi:hypothetical protein